LVVQVTQDSPDFQETIQDRLVFLDILVIAEKEHLVTQDGVEGLVGVAGLAHRDIPEHLVLLAGQAILVQVDLDSQATLDTRVPKEIQGLEFQVTPVHLVHLDAVDTLATQDQEYQVGADHLASVGALENLAIVVTRVVE
jgi:hypothetical protein